MNKVVPIIEPKINWNDLLVLPPTKALDRSQRSMHEYLAYLQYLSVFSLGGLDHLYYNQLFFTFLIELDREDLLNLLKNTDLNVVENESLIFVSGTLDLWIKACLFPWNTFNLRSTFNQITLYFERWKLVRFNKTVLSDGTFTIRSPS